MLHLVLILFLAWHPGIDTAAAHGFLFAYLAVWQLMVRPLGDLVAGELGAMLTGVLVHGVLLLAMWHQPWFSAQEVLTGYAAFVVVVNLVMLWLAFGPLPRRCFDPSHA